MAETSMLLILQLLDWIDRQPRSYADTMAAWRSCCPQMPVWEDALHDGLVRVAHPPGIEMGRCPVVLTAHGRQFLQSTDHDSKNAAD